MAVTQVEKDVRLVTLYTKPICLEVESVETKEEALRIKILLKRAISEKGWRLLTIKITGKMDGTFVLNALVKAMPLCGDFSMKPPVDSKGLTWQVVETEVVVIT